MKKYHNYFILIVVTIGVFYISWWVLAQYKVSKDYARNISTLNDVVAYRLQPVELSPYLRENRDVFMIVTNTHDKHAGRFEKNIAAVINKYGINSNIVLYNISEKPDMMFKNLETVSKTNLLTAPAIFYYLEGKMVDGINEHKNTIKATNLKLKKNNKNDQSLSQQDIINFLKNYGLIS